MVRCHSSTQDPGKHWLLFHQGCVLEVLNTSQPSIIPVWKLLFVSWPFCLKGSAICVSCLGQPALVCFPRGNGASWSMPPLVPGSRPSQSGLQTTAALTHFLPSLLSVPDGDEQTTNQELRSGGSSQLLRRLEFLICYSWHLIPRHASSVFVSPA